MNAVDSITKYVLAHLFVEKRTTKKCIEFLSQIKTTCYNQISTKYYIRKYSRGKKKKRLIIFVCDKFANYKTAFSKYAVERYNGKTKDRIKNIRGGFGSFEFAKDFMNLRRIIHNFVNPHQELKGKTPAEMAEIILPPGRNKLLNLIEYVAREYH